MSHKKFAVGAICLALVCVGLSGLGFNAAAQFIPPTVPTGVTASFASPARVTISWTAPASTSTTAGYYVYRNGGLIANTGSLSVTDTVPPGIYSYTVAAYGPDGTVYQPSSPSAPLTVALDTTPPTTPTGLTASALTSSSISLSWTAATDNVGVMGYYINRDGNHFQTLNPVVGTSYTDTNLRPDTVYTYQVMAYDAAGNISGVSNSLNVPTLPAVFTISVPYNVRAQAVSTSEIDVKWNAATDVSSTPIYYLYRDSVPLASTSATSYNDTSLSAGTAYWYSVIAFDASGNASRQSDTAGTSTFAAPAPASMPSPIVAPSANATNGAAPAAVSAPPVSVGQFTTTLSFSSRDPQVKALQGLLIKEGYLGPAYATGLFGALTQKAVQQFQCAQNIVCSGSPWTTGWGLVGAKTRKALNTASQK